MGGIAPVVSIQVRCGPEPGSRIIEARPATRSGLQELDLQTAFAGGIGQCFDFPVEQEATAVEIGLFNTGFLRALRDFRTDLGGRFDVVLADNAQMLFRARMRRPASRQFTSSINWTLMFLLERCTESRRRPAFTLRSLFRTRRRRFKNSCLLLFAIFCVLTSSCLLCGR